MGAVIIVLDLEINGIYQIATDRTATKLSKIVVRHYLDGGWSNWMHLITNINLTPNVYYDDILAYANSLSAGFYPISTGSGTINGVTGYSGIGYIAKTNNTGIVIFITLPYNQKTFTNVYNGEWKGWKELALIQ